MIQKGSSVLDPCVSSDLAFLNRIKINIVMITEKKIAITSLRISYL